MKIKPLESIKLIGNIISKDFIEIELPSSKSISNRVLIIRHLSNSGAKIHNLSSAEDTQLLTSFLEIINSNDYKEKSLLKNNLFYCKNAGTTTRFLIALLAITKGIWQVDADKRMQNRPIIELIDILNGIGAYIKTKNDKEIFPLTIIGRQLSSKATIYVKSNLTSQIISALLLISAKINNGLKIFLPQKQFSRPYIDMTIKLVNQFGGYIDKKDNLLICKQSEYNFNDYFIEKDFSAACFFYEAICLDKKLKFLLKDLKPTDLQIDSKCQKYFVLFGIETLFIDKGALIYYDNNLEIKNRDIEFDLSETPDIFTSLVTAAYFSNKQVCFANIDSLRVKESDRLAAMAKELNKIEKRCFIEKDCFIILPSEQKNMEKYFADKVIDFCTYSDHRIAMALSLTCLILNQINIENPSCVKKSFPEFFQQLSSFIN